MTAMRCVDTFWNCPGMCNRISLALALVFVCATASSGYSQRPYAGRSFHVNACCSPGAKCSRCVHRHRLHHGRRAPKQRKKATIPAIARFHPVPTRPVFELRHALPRPTVAPLRPVPVPPPPLDAPGGELPQDASAASVVRPAPARTTRRLDSEPRTMRAPDLPAKARSNAGVTHGTRRASHVAPVTPARRSFAWFFSPPNDDR